MLLDLPADGRTLDAALHGAARDRAVPPGANLDWTVPQNWARFTSEEHDVWDHLFERQVRLLEGRVIDAFWDGLDVLKIGTRGIPEFSALNDRLFPSTGWTVVAVPGLIPDAVFFEHLRQRRFPAGNFIRTPDQIDYLVEPDVFHDLFGHVPLLADARIGRLTERLGELALEAEASGTLNLLARLYWRTIEFGLAQEHGKTRIYGGGIASSASESLYALESPEAERRGFLVDEVLRKPYRSDKFQDVYYLVEDLEELVASFAQRSWNELLNEGAKA